MLEENLTEEVLILPAKQEKCDELKIVSGYATASMAARHFDLLEEKGIANIKISVVVGMGVVGKGLLLPQHKGFQKLSNSEQRNFHAAYITDHPAIHSKVYVWSKGGKPTKAFLGSANYTQRGFGKSTLEVLDKTDPHHAERYYEKSKARAHDCNLKRMDEIATFPKWIKIPQRDEEKPPEKTSEEQVRLPLFIVKRGETHAKAGLNWGHRDRRDRNEAYIPIPSTERHRNILPPLKQRFEILTDDGFSLAAVIAQEEGKAIETPDDNSDLGRYFRRRLGLKDGQFIEMKHLQNYGRTYVTISQIDDETYYMDFSPNMGPGEK